MLTWIQSAFGDRGGILRYARHNYNGIIFVAGLYAIAGVAIKFMTHKYGCYMQEREAALRDRRGPSPFTHNEFVWRATEGKPCSRGFRAETG